MWPFRWSLASLGPPATVRVAVRRQFAMHCLSENGGYGFYNDFAADGSRVRIRSFVLKRLLHIPPRLTVGRILLKIHPEPFELFALRRRDFYVFRMLDHF